MADSAADVEAHAGGGAAQTAKDLFAGASGGIAQVLLGERAHFTSPVGEWMHVQTLPDKCPCKTGRTKWRWEASQ